MKRLLIGMIMMAFAIHTAAAGYLGVYGAYWDTKDADSELGFGAKLSFALSPQLHLQLRGKYFEFSQDGVGGPGTSATLEVIPIQGALVYHLDAGLPVRPYIGGGVGYYLFDIEWSDRHSTMNPDVDDEFGYFALAGALLEVNPSFGLFIEASYSWVEIKRIGGFETTGDDTLDGFGLNAGLTLHW